MRGEVYFDRMQALANVGAFDLWRHMAKIAERAADHCCYVVGALPDNEPAPWHFHFDDGYIEFIPWTDPSRISWIPGGGSYLRVRPRNGRCLVTEAALVDKS